MNPFRRFLDFISYPSHSRTIGFLAFLVVLLAVPLTVNIAQKQQELRQRAAFESGGGNVRNCYPPAQAPSNCTLDTNQNPPCSPIILNTGAPGDVIYQNWFLCGTSGGGTTNGSAGTTDTCTPAGGNCLSVQTCHNPDANPLGVAGTVDTSKTCSGSTVCCMPGNGAGGNPTPTLSPDQAAIKACQDQGGTCLDNGKCILGPNNFSNVTCPIKPGGGTCDLSSAGPFDYKCDCTTSDGTPGHHAIKVCTAGGTATDPTCYAGTSACGTGGGGTPTPTPMAGCDASKGFISSCQGITAGTTKPNPSACTQSNGQSGYSLMQCQGSCWYDSYYDQRPEKAPQSQWCYPKGNLISFIVGLDGIGQTGDQKNPNPNPISNQSRGSNQNPKTTTRTFFYQVFDSTGTTEQAKGQGSIAYDSGSGKYKASATLSKTLADGTYVLKVRVQGLLAKIVRGVTISGGVAQIPNTNLVNGDTNSDNRLAIDDYNLILSCAFKPMTTACTPADLDDNGVVDQFDYNLFIREFSVVQDGD